MALGLTAALIVARAFYPPEDASAGSGRGWIVWVLVAAAVAVAGALVSGVTRIRLAWADAAVIALVGLVATSSFHAADMRPALNMAWEWIALGIVYLLVRWLPRDRGESSALAACLMATAVALAAYGLVQVAIEFPELHAQYLRNPQAVLADAGMDPNLAPNSPERKHFEDRLLGSNEPFSTFALANSLAGFLVGPIVLALAVLLDRFRATDGRRPPVAAFALASLPFLIVLACLLLTKSRSAYLGLLVGGLIALLGTARNLPRRGILLGTAGFVAVLALFVAAAAATGHLDIQVLTESSKSLKYRMEYWRATLALLGDGGRWWSGVGPGNFGRAYLKFKLPESSESIADPHNLFLDVWAAAGLPALLALGTALVLAAWDLFGRPQDTLAGGDGDEPVGPDKSGHPGWILACGLGGWMLAWPLGELNPFTNALRWLALGIGWAGAVALAAPLWGRRPVPAWGLGAAAVAVVVNLLAAGGIAFPSIALALWIAIALGLNLRDDRACGRERVAGRYVLAFVLASILAALIGMFYGAVLAPTWARDDLLAQARAAKDRRSPDLVGAKALYHRAAEADRYSPEPWIELAAFELQVEDAKKQIPGEKDVMHIANHLATALEPPRNPGSFATLISREQILGALLDRLAGTPGSSTIQQLKEQRADVLRRATALYPTNVRVRARLAVALAELGRFGEATEQAEEVLRLDDLTPHAEMKLDKRANFEADLALWRDRARRMGGAAPAPPPAP